MPVKPKQRDQGAAEALALKEKQRYVKGYLQVITNLYKRGAFSQEQARIAELAYKRRLPPSGFVALVRKHDPSYPQTQEFKVRSTEAKDVWQRFRPGRPMPQEYSARYIRSSLNQQQLIEKSQRATAARNAVSPFPQAQNNPAAYRQMREMLNTSFRQSNSPEDVAHPTLHRMIFSSKMKDQEINDQFADLFGGKDVFRWMQGLSPRNAESIQNSVFSPPNLTPRLSTAPPVFLGNQQNQFHIGVDDLSAALISSEI